MIAPRTTAEPRPVCSPVSDSASDQPMLTPAPRAVEKPTSSAVCELEAIAAAKIGASEETVPSIMPTSAGCTTRSTKSALVLEARAVDQAGDQRDRGAGAVFACVHSWSQTA